MCMGAKTVQNWMMNFLFPILQVLPDPVMSIKKVREITFQNLQFYQTLETKFQGFYAFKKKYTKYSQSHFLRCIFVNTHWVK